MRLLKLVTKNFKKLGTFTADFTQGLNVIAGDNARGKSTLLQAIGAALFGVTVVPGKKENIPTWGQTKFDIDLLFQLPCGTYRLVRTMTTAKLTRLHADKDDELVANGNTPVTAEVESLLGLTAKDWDLFVQSKQGSSAGVLDFGAAALNRKVEEFAGVDLIDKVQAEAQRQATLNNGRADANAVSDETLQLAEQELQSASERLQLAGTDVEASVQEQEAHGSFSEQKPASSSEMRQQIAKVTNLSGRITLAEVQLANDKQRVEEARMRVEGRALQDEELVSADLAKAREVGTSFAQQKGDLQRELDQFRALKQTADEADLTLDTQMVGHTAMWANFEPDDVESEMQLATESVAGFKADLAREQEEVGKAKATYDNLLQLSDGAVCPTCNRAKEDHDPVKLKEEAHAALTYWESRKLRVTQLTADVETCASALKALTDKVAAYETSIAALDKAIAADTAAKAALKTVRDGSIIQDELTGTEGQLDQSRTTYAELNAKLAGVSANNLSFHQEAEALTKAETALKASEATLKRVNDDLEALPEPPTEEQLKAAEEAEAAYQVALDAWRVRDNALGAAVAQAKSDHRFATERRTTAQTQLDNLKAMVATALEHTTLAKKYSRLVQFLRERRQVYLKEVWDTIMTVGSRLVRTASKDTITRIANDEGEFQFEEEGIMAPTANASGAQKAMIGVSLRVGLARALYGKDALLIFDEPTADCREHNAAALAAMIAGSAKQVLLITHRETDQALAQNIVNVGD